MIKFNGQGRVQWAQPLVRVLRNSARIIPGCGYLAFIARDMLLLDAAILSCPCLHSHIDGCPAP